MAFAFAVEVGSVGVKAFVKNEVRRRKKIVGYVTRGEKSEDGVGVGVAVEGGSA